MTENKKSASPNKSSPDSLTKAGPDAGITLDEEQLKKVTGGAANTGFKAVAGFKIDTTVTSDLKINSFK